MKHYALLSTLLFIMGCSSGNQQKSYQCVTRLENYFSIDSLHNCTVAAAFGSDNFNWQEKCLDMTVYSEYLYDSAAIDCLQVGDTLLFDGKSIPVDSLAKRNGFVAINGGIECGGVDLTAYEDGTYRATTFNGHSVYQEMGKAHLKLADDFAIIDCGELPSDPCDTIHENQDVYLRKLPEYRRDFYQLNTRVRIENGQIKEINRRWIP